MRALHVAAIPLALVVIVSGLSGDEAHATAIADTVYMMRTGEALYAEISPEGPRTERMFSINSVLIGARLGLTPDGNPTKDTLEIHARLDARQRITELVDNDGLRVEQAYGHDGLVQEIFNSRFGRMHYVRDAAGRPLQVSRCAISVSAGACNNEAASMWSSFSYKHDKIVNEQSEKSSLASDTVQYVYGSDNEPTAIGLLKEVTVKQSPANGHGIADVNAREPGGRELGERELGGRETAEKSLRKSFVYDVHGRVIREHTTISSSTLASDLHGGEFAVERSYNLQDNLVEVRGMLGTGSGLGAGSAGGTVTGTGTDTGTASVFHSYVPGTGVLASVSGAGAGADAGSAGAGTNANLLASQFMWDNDGRMQSTDFVGKFGKMCWRRLEDLPSGFALLPSSHSTVGVDPCNMEPSVVGNALLAARWNYDGDGLPLLAHIEGFGRRNFAEFLYDQQGKLQNTCSLLGQISYQYSSSGRPLTVRRTDAAGELLSTYSWNRSGGDIPGGSSGNISANIPGDVLLGVEHVYTSNIASGGVSGSVSDEGADGRAIPLCSADVFVNDDVGFRISGTEPALPTSTQRRQQPPGKLQQQYGWSGRGLLTAVAMSMSAAATSPAVNADDVGNTGESGEVGAHAASALTERLFDNSGGLVAEWENGRLRTVVLGSDVTLNGTELSVSSTVGGMVEIRKVVDIANPQQQRSELVLKDRVGSTSVIVSLSDTREANGHASFGVEGSEGGVDGSEGVELLEWNEREPYGLAHEGTGFVATRSKKNVRDFAAGVLSPSTGLHTMGVRSYDPARGVWLSPDAVIAADADNCLARPRDCGLTTYSGANPVALRDSSGAYIESAWDAFNITLGMTSLGINLGKGDYWAAAVDAAGLSVDGAALVLPGVPGGAGSAIKATRAASVVDKAFDASRAADKVADSATTASKAINKSVSKVGDAASDVKSVTKSSGSRGGSKYGGGSSRVGRGDKGGGDSHFVENTGLRSIETKSSTSIKQENSLKDWNDFLGSNQTSVNSRTGKADPDRIFSADGTKSIRFGKHEVKSPNKIHYHKESWHNDRVEHISQHVVPVK